MSISMTWVGHGVKRIHVDLDDLVLVWIEEHGLRLKEAVIPAVVAKARLSGGEIEDINQVSRAVDARAHQRLADDGTEFGKPRDQPDGPGHQSARNVERLQAGDPGKERRSGRARSSIRPERRSFPGSPAWRRSRSAPRTCPPSAREPRRTRSMSAMGRRDRTPTKP